MNPVAPTQPVVRVLADAAGQAADPLADQWDGVVRALTDAGLLSGLVRELAWQGGLVAIQPGAPEQWVLLVEHDALRQGGLGDKLAQALSAHLGRPLTLEMQAGQPADSPSRRETQHRLERQAEADAQIKADPQVQALLGQFSSARIVQGSIKAL